MTMVKNGMTIEALSQEYMVRTYAIPEDGSVVYSDLLHEVLLLRFSQLKKRKKGNPQKTRSEKIMPLKKTQSGLFLIH